MFKRISKIFNEEEHKKLDESGQQLNQSIEVVVKSKTGLRKQLQSQISQMQQSSIEVRKMQKYERSLNEFVQSDQDGRNILHRAALEQNPKLISDIIEEYRTVCQKDSLCNYVNLKDKFGLSPVQMCCFSNQVFGGDMGTTPRCESIKSLHKEGGNLNQSNPRTLWSAIHWVACYGDSDSLRFLLQQDCIQFATDYQGFYPLDLAGRNGHKGCVELMVVWLSQFLMDYEKWKYNSIRCVKRQELIEDCQEHWDRHLSNPLLKVSLLFWACFYKMNQQQIQQILNLRSVYVLAPLYSQDLMTPLHAAIKMNNLMAVKAILDHNMKLRKEVYELAEQRNHGMNLLVTYQMNNIFVFTLGEVQIYSQEYRRNIVNFHNWEEQYLINFQLVYYRRLEKQDSEHVDPLSFVPPQLKQLWPKKKRKTVNYIDQQDLYGNTPLHLAAIENSADLITLLIAAGARMEIENKEMWLPQDLASDQQNKTIFQQCVSEATTKEMTASIRQFLSSCRLLITKQGDTKLYFNDYLRALKEDELSPYLISLNKLCQDILMPDYVIKCKVTANNLPMLNRLNFQISLLQNARFHIYLARSQFEDCYYIMLRHSLEQLEVQAIISKMEVKLIDSYDNEPYDMGMKESRQRQEIIEQHLNRIINMEEQKEAGIFQSYYRMHSLGGMAKIREKWIESPKWYCPQPLNQMDDYLLEGKTQNFTSCTLLRLYFGEKISFFFAWKSYLTCAMVFVAVPGCALQTYILYTSNFDSLLLPIWVVYVSVWSTVSVEFWKRKSCEINARWGMLDLMNDENEQQQMREGFSGDEEMDLVAKEVTKNEKKIYTIVVFLISIPILLILTSLVVLIFLAIDYYNTKYAQDSTIQKVIVGIMQGGSITVLNIIYTTIAYWFALKENHKFQTDFETSLIYKNVLFKFLNSYLAIGYSAFIKTDSTLEELFYLMLPVLIIKQVNYIILSVTLPSLLYKHREDQYFVKLTNNISPLYQNSQSLHQQVFRDAIEILWGKVTSKPLKSQPRAVLQIIPGQTQSTIVPNIDVDLVELNGLKFEADNNLVVNYFMESMIDYGYISLFAAAFPIGPAIALLMNIVEIRMKIITYLYVYKKPSAERAAGIGEWLTIWEAMSFCGVFSNFALLYFRQEKQMREYFQIDSNDSVMIWVFLFMVFLLTMVKYLLQILIPDKPEWVLKCEEELKSKRKSKSGSEESIKEKQFECQQLSNKVDELQQQLKLYKKKFKAASKNQNLNQLIQSPSRQGFSANLSELQPLNAPKVDDKIKKVFYGLERELLYQRLEQFKLLAQQKGELFLLCAECQLAQATLFCDLCNVQMCHPCFQQYHKQQDLDHTEQFIPLQSREEVKSQPRSGWFKFQYFALPSTTKSLFFPILQHSYDQLESLYTFTTAGISNCEFLKLHEFNIEDKFQINRIMFIILKKNQGKPIWNDFFRQIKILQEGTLEQKILQLIEILDENGDGNISQKEFERICLSCFIQDVSLQRKVSTILQALFEQKTSLTKKEMMRKILISIERSQDFKDFISCLLQK